MPIRAPSRIRPAATVNKATQVRVINATGISGYAGQKADVLQTAGYTSVEADQSERHIAGFFRGVVSE